MDHAHDSFPARLSPGIESVSSDRRLPDGYLPSDCRPGPAPGSSRGRLWHRPDSPRDHFPGQSGIGISDTAGGIELADVLVPISKIGAGGAAGRLPGRDGIVRRSTNDHLYPGADDYAAALV